jgi:hypothetical protein
MVVTGGNSYAYGIRIWARNDIFAAVTDNDMSGRIWGDNRTYGIYLISGDGNSGSETSPVTISGNRMAVTSGNDEAYGIYFGAHDDLFAAITDNDMSGGISGYDNAFGIYLSSISGDIGSETSPVTISGNRMVVTSRDVLAFGIRIWAVYDIFAAVTGNDMSGGIWGDNRAYGIYINSGSGIGSETAPVTISGNRMAVKSGNNAYGIYIIADNDLFAKITGNDMSGGISGDWSAYGIYFDSLSGGIGSEACPVTVSGNRMVVTGRNNDAYGIYITAVNDIFAKITGNDMSGGISGAWPAYGIYLNSSGGGIGSETTPVTISGNHMAVKSGNANALGIYIITDNDLFAAICGNRMDILAANDAWGAYLHSFSGAIGSAATPTLFQNNSGTITGLISRYMLWIEDAVSGSSVNWAGSSFTPVGGGWSGNYPVNTWWIQDNLIGGTITP